MIWASLTIGPRLRDRRVHRALVVGDAGCERGDEAPLGFVDPSFELNLGFLPDHLVEAVNESSGIAQHALFNRDNCDGLGLGQVVPLRCHQPCYRPGGGDPLQLLSTVATTACPLHLQEGQMAVDRAQTGPEDVRSPAATDLADKVTAVPRPTDDLFDWYIVAEKRGNCIMGVLTPQVSPDIATFPQRSGGLD